MLGDKMLRVTVLLISALFYCAGMTVAVAAPRNVPAAPIFLTSPAADETDDRSETVAVPGGFLVAWTRSNTSTGEVSVLARRFDMSGEPLDKIAKVRKPAFGVGGRPELLALDSRRVAVFWLESTFLYGGIFDLKDNKITGVKKLGTFGDLIHDVVRLSNGDIALVMVDTDISNPSDVREKVSLTIFSPRLAKRKGPTSVHGKGFEADGWNMFDHTIVDRKNSGGLVIYRDREGGQLFARAFKSSGALSGKAFRVNTTKLQLGLVSDQILFEVKAVRLTDGRIAIAWVSREGAGADGTQVRARLFDAAGEPLGKDFLVHADKTGVQSSPELVALPNGRFAVLWAKQVNGFENSLWVRAFDKDGEPEGPEQVTEDGTALELSRETEAARLGDGSLVNILDGFIGGGRVRAEGIEAP